MSDLTAQQRLDEARLALHELTLGKRVAKVMVDGQWLMRDGRLLTLDEDAIVREASHVARTAWRRLFETRPDLTPPPGMLLT